MHEVSREPPHKIALGDGVNLGAIGSRSQNRELVGADIQVILVNAEQRLIAKARAAWVRGRSFASGIRVIEVIDGPRCGRITGRVHGDIGAAFTVVAADKENRGKPRICSRIEVTARIAGVFPQSFAKEDVDIERSGDHRTIRTKDAERRIDGFHDKTVANTEALVGRLKLGAEIGDSAIETAYAVEVPQQTARTKAIQWRGLHQRCLTRHSQSCMRRMDPTGAFRAQMSWGCGHGT